MIAIACIYTLTNRSTNLHVSTLKSHQQEVKKKGIIREWASMYVVAVNTGRSSAISRAE